MERSANLQKARQLLCAGEYTCVLCGGDTVHTSTQRGVAPLLALIDAGTDVSGFSAADKVVGKATALLYCFLGVKAVYAQVISESALQVLQDSGIAAGYAHCVSYIQNRAGDGRCPMETATQTIQNPAEALVAIRDTLKRLQEGL